MQCYHPQNVVFLYHWFPFKGLAPPTSCKQCAAGFKLGVTKLTDLGNDKTV
jgi:hypothetical protein